MLPWNYYESEREICCSIITIIAHNFLWTLSENFLAYNAFPATSPDDGKLWTNFYFLMFNVAQKKQFIHATNKLDEN